MKRQPICALAAQLFEGAIASGLPWDDSLSALGLAAKALVDAAINEGDGPVDECMAHAYAKFLEGFSQNVSVVLAGAEENQLQHSESMKADFPNPAPTFSISSITLTMLH